MQEFSAIQGELSNRFEEPSQPAPVIRVHAPKGQVEEEGGDWDEEERKSASRDLGPPVPGGRKKAFPAGSVLDAAMLPRNTAGTGNGEMSLIPPGKEKTSKISVASDNRNSSSRLKYVVP